MKSFILTSFFLFVNIFNLYSDSVKSGFGAGLPKLVLQDYFSVSYGIHIRTIFNTDIRYLKLFSEYKYDYLKNSASTLNLHGIYGGIEINDFTRFFFNPYVMIGAGGVLEFLTVNSNRYSNNDPALMLVLGLEFPEEKIMYVEAAYYFIYQKSQLNALYNGAVLNFEIGIRLVSW